MNRTQKGEDKWLKTSVRITVPLTMKKHLLHRSVRPFLSKQQEQKAATQLMEPKEPLRTKSHRLGKPESRSAKT